MSSRKVNLILFIIIALAALIRLIFILRAGAFYWDELFTFTFAQKNWAEAWQYWPLETNSPAHLLITKLWLLIFPANEFFTRLPSLLFGLGGIYLIYRLGQKLFNAKTGLIAAALLALSPLHLFFSASARGYALLILLTLWSLNSFCDNFYLPAGKRRYLPLALANFLLLFTHLTAVFVLAGEAAALLWLRRDKLKTYLTVNLAPVLLFVAWQIFSGLQKIRPETFSQSWFFLFTSKTQAAYTALRNLTIGPAPWPFFLLVTALIIYFFIRAWPKNGAQNKERLLLCGLFILIPFLSAAALGTYNIKFIMVAQGALILITAYLITATWPGLIWPLIFVVLSLAPGIKGTYAEEPLNNWDGFNQIINAACRPDKKQILIYNHFVDQLSLKRYYRGCLPTLPYATVAQQKNWNRALVTDNYLRYPHAAEEIDGWLDANRVATYDEIFLLQEEHIGLDLNTRLEQGGWRLLGKEKLKLLETKYLYHYAKP